ncbi:MAG: hypothetical protein Q9227_005173 [Pyrenula ochraceoflavens]
MDTISQTNGQPALETAMKNDPDGHRTLGVLTKPDLSLVYHPKLKRAYKYVKLVKDNLVDAGKSHWPLYRGWCVVQNQEPNTSNAEKSRRDHLEQETLNKEPWNQVPPGSRGINDLQRRIEDITYHFNSTALPALRERAEQRLAVEEAAWRAMIIEPKSQRRIESLVLEFRQDFETEFETDYKTMLHPRVDDSMVNSCKVPMEEEAQPELYRDCAKEIQERCQNPGRLIGQLDEDLVLELFKNQSSEWPKIVDDAARDMAGILSDGLRDVYSRIAVEDDIVKKVVQAILDEIFQSFAFFKPKQLVLEALGSSNVEAATAKLMRRPNPSEEALRAAKVREKKKEIERLQDITRRLHTIKTREGHSSVGKKRLSSENPDESRLTKHRKI